MNDPLGVAQASLRDASLPETAVRGLKLLATVIESLRDCKKLRSLLPSNRDTNCETSCLWVLADYVRVADDDQQREALGRELQVIDHQARVAELADALDSGSSE